MRNYETGATRNSDEGKPQYAKIGDPTIDKAYADYMNAQAVQADGKIRPADNWKKGIPVADYLDSQRRHWHDVWFHLSGQPEQAEEKDLVTALCALKFNVDGMLYEVLKDRAAKKAEAAAEEGLCQAARRAEEKLRRDWSVANPSLCTGCGRYGPGGPCPTCYPDYNPDYPDTYPKDGT